MTNEEQDNEDNTQEGGGMGFMNNVETSNDHQNTKDNDDKILRCHSRC
jgi:hypothetical protein